MCGQGKTVMKDRSKRLDRETRDCLMDGWIGNVRCGLWGEMQRTLRTSHVSSFLRILRPA